MKSTQLRLALFTVGILIFPMSSTQAQGMLDAGKSLFGGGNTGAAAGGTAGVLSALPLDKIIELVQKQGYSNITGLAPSPSGNTLQAAATNSSGSPVNLLINPTSGGVISALGR